MTLSTSFLRLASLALLVQGTLGVDSAINPVVEFAQTPLADVQSSHVAPVSVSGIPSFASKSVQLGQQADELTRRATAHLFGKRGKVVPNGFIQQGYYTK